MKTSMILSAAFASALFAADSVAGTLRVPAHYRTIQQAVTAASPGDVVVVSAGTYDPFEITAKNDITVKGEGRVWIDARGFESGIGVGLASGIRLEKLRIRDADLNGISILLARVTVKKCHIRGSGQHGIGMVTASDSQLIRNKIQDVAEDGIHILSSGVIATGNRIKRPGGNGINVRGDRNTLTGNTVVDAGNYSLLVGEVTRTDSDNLLMDNEVSGAFYGEIILLGGGANNSVLSNTISDNPHNGVFAGTPNAVVDGNKIQQTGKGIHVSRMDCRVSGNKVKRAGDGLFLSVFATDNHVERNKVKRSGRMGFDVESASNQFLRNVVLRSGTVDLNDTAGPGMNTYIDNTFGTTN